MVEIRNKLNQRLTINLKSGTLELLARSTAVVSEDDFSSTHLQNLLGSGKIILESREDKLEKKKPKKAESSEEEISGSGSSEPAETVQPEVPGNEEIPGESPESGQPGIEAEPHARERRKRK